MPAGHVTVRCQLCHHSVVLHVCRLPSCWSCDSQVFTTVWCCMCVCGVCRWSLKCPLVMLGVSSGADPGGGGGGGGGE